MLASFIISDIIYVIGGFSKGETVNTIYSFDRGTQTWMTLQPMKDKRWNHTVCLRGNRIIVAGGDSGQMYLDTKSKRFVLPHPCSASHQSNAYSVYFNLPSTCSWSTLPRMTAKRRNFSLVCLPPDEGGLIAIGGYDGNKFIDVVECLTGDGAKEWRWLAPCSGLITHR